MIMIYEIWLRDMKYNCEMIDMIVRYEIWSWDMRYNCKIWLLCQYLVTSEKGYCRFLTVFPTRSSRVLELMSRAGLAEKLLGTKMGGWRGRVGETIIDTWWWCCSSLLDMLLIHRFWARGQQTSQHSTLMKKSCFSFSFNRRQSLMKDVHWWKLIFLRQNLVCHIVMR